MHPLSTVILSAIVILAISITIFATSVSTGWAIFYLVALIANVWVLNRNVKKIIR